MSIRDSANKKSKSIVDVPLISNLGNRRKHLPDFRDGFYLESVIERSDDGVADKKHKMADALEVVGLPVVGGFPSEDDRQDQCADLEGVEVERELDAVGVSQSHQDRNGEHDGDGRGPHRDVDDALDLIVAGRFDGGHDLGGDGDDRDDQTGQSRRDAHFSGDGHPVGCEEFGEHPDDEDEAEDCGKIPDVSEAVENVILVFLLVVLLSMFFDPKQAAFGRRFEKVGVGACLEDEDGDVETDQHQCDHHRGVKEGVTVLRVGQDAGNEQSRRGDEEDRRVGAGGVFVVLLLLVAESADEDRQAQQDVHIHDDGGDDSPFDRLQGRRVVNSFTHDHKEQNDFDGDSRKGQNETGIGLFQTFGEDFGDLADGDRKRSDRDRGAEDRKIGGVSEVKIDSQRSKKRS